MAVLFAYLMKTVLLKTIVICVLNVKQEGSGYKALGSPSPNCLRTSVREPSFQVQIAGLRCVSSSEFLVFQSNFHLRDCILMELFSCCMKTGQ